jgi:hypothetical protein
MTGDEPALSQPSETTGSEPELSGARPKCEVCGASYRYKVFIMGEFRHWSGCDCPNHLVRSPYFSLPNNLGYSHSLVDFTQTTLI